MDKNITKLIEYPEKGIISKTLFKSKSVDATLFCMAKGVDMSEHTSTRQAIVYVVEGDGIFNLEGKKIEMKPGVIINMKENAIHSLKANKNTSFILILV